MTIDKHTLDKAKKWAESLLTEFHSDGLEETVDAAAEVIRDLPTVIVDGDKLREVINEVLANYPHGTLGHHVAEELACKLQDLIPSPEPQVEIALGAWAMHPEHGKVLISSDKADRAGDVRVHVKDPSAAVGAVPVRVTAADLSPLPDTHDDSEGQSEYAPGGVLPGRTSAEKEQMHRTLEKLNQQYTEPQPGEAWEFVCWGERFVGLVTNENNLLSIRCGGSGPRNIKVEDAEALRRLVPAQESRELTTEQDYREAADETIVRRHGNANAAYEKWSRDEWRSTAGTNHTDREMAENSVPRTVLWEPK